VEHDIDAKCTSVLNIINYLSELFKSGLQYRSVASARSAICTFLKLHGNNAGESPLLERLMKGIGRVRPAMPKYHFTWEVRSVLDALLAWGSTVDLELRELTLKTAMLLALCSPNRVSELASLRLSCMTRSSGSFSFFFPELTKTKKIGPAHKAIYSAFPENEQLCPVVTLSFYLEKTEELRGSSDRLFLSWIGKHANVTSASIARWLRTVLNSSGISSEFKAHSTRSAAASAASLSGLSAAQIMKAANWAPGSSTFARFYHRTTAVSFTSAVLSGENSNAMTLNMHR
jgi:integrase